MEPYVYVEECSHSELCKKMNELHVMGYRMQGSVVVATYTEHNSPPYNMLGVMMYLKLKDEQ